MVDRVHAAWRNGHITGVRLMDIKAAFPSVAQGRIVNLMKVRKMDGELPIRENGGDDNPGQRH
jgi:hypothetical protein